MPEGQPILLAAAAELLAEATGRNPLLTGSQIVAIGWATIELDRAERELGAALGPDGDWEAASRDPLLGATARVRRTPDGRSPLVLILEPDTEGRLAASLARRGEGVVAIYLAARNGTAFPPGSLSPPAAGPLGPARLVMGGRLGTASILVLAQDSIQ